MRLLSMHVLSEANACVVSDYPTVQAPAALALRGSARSADRPVGCDARRRSCVGYALDQAARRVSSQRPTCDCSACMSSLRLMRVWSPITLLFKPLLLSLSEAARAPLIALSGVTLAAATASATLSIEAAALALRSLNGSGCSLLSTCTEDRPGVCNASCRSCVGYALDPSCCSCSQKLERHRLLAARRAHR